MDKLVNIPDIPSLIFNSVFDDFLVNLPENKRYPSSGFPIVDYYVNSEGNGVLEFALAGYELEDINIDVEGSNVVVWSDGVEEKVEKSFCKRIARRSFKNIFFNKDNVYDLENLKADYKNGLLKITLFKRQQSKSKRISIVNK